ncbi:hypothetical protein, partial [Pseudomonas sp. Y39-6]|uniref:hypothetical protein n=1 Tax=Pseudomonas sp. Y39-6 TaxID=2749807 RepID=UPI001F3A9A0F
QETLTAGLLTFACVLGISERHLLHRGSTVQFVGQPYLTRFGSLFQSFLKGIHMASAITGSTQIAQPQPVAIKPQVRPAMPADSDGDHDGSTASKVEQPKATSGSVGTRVNTTA